MKIKQMTYASDDTLLILTEDGQLFERAFKGSIAYWLPVVIREKEPTVQEIFQEQVDLMLSMSKDELLKLPGSRSNHPDGYSLKKRLWGYDHEHVQMTLSVRGLDRNGFDARPTDRTSYRVRIELTGNHATISPIYEWVNGAWLPELNSAGGGL